MLGLAMEDQNEEDSTRKSELPKLAPSLQDLDELMDSKNSRHLKSMGNVKGLAEKLGSDVSSGLKEDATALSSRRSVYARPSNFFPLSP